MSTGEGCHSNHVEEIYIVSVIHTGMLVLSHDTTILKITSAV